MPFAKYTLDRKHNILKEGHTMFLEDVVRDLARKSYLEELHVLDDTALRKLLSIADECYPPLVFKKKCLEVINAYRIDRSKI